MRHLLHLTGFIIGSFASNSLIGFSSPTNIMISYYTTAISIFATVHVVIITTFLSIWGPGLALRGSTGSVSKAYAAMSAEMPEV
jgi:hypothetical protein